MDRKKCSPRCGNERGAAIPCDDRGNDTTFSPIRKIAEAAFAQVRWLEKVSDSAGGPSPARGGCVGFGHAVDVVRYPVESIAAKVAQDVYPAGAGSASEASPGRRRVRAGSRPARGGGVGFGHAVDVVRYGLWAADAQGPWPPFLRPRMRRECVRILTQVIPNCVHCAAICATDVQPHFSYFCR